MRSALHRMDIVGVCEDRFVVGVGPLQRDFNVDALTHAFEENHVVQRGAALAHRFDEFRDPALIMEFLVLAGASVLEPDFEPGVEIGHFAQVARDYFVLEEDLFENCRIRRECSFGAGTFGGAALLDLVLGHTVLVVLVINLAVLADLDFELHAQCVNHRSPDAMQTAGNLVRAAIEFAARMQDRVHDFEGVALLRRMRSDRNSATVIFDRNAIVAQNLDVDLGAMTGQRLVNRVIDDLRDQMMETALGGVADVHAGALANRLETLENPDGLSAVTVGTLFVCHRKRQTALTSQPSLTNY